MKYKKPPLGVTPSKFWIKDRINGISQAILNYICEELTIPMWWVTEYNELRKELDNLESEADNNG